MEEEKEAKNNNNEEVLTVTAEVLEPKQELERLDYFTEIEKFHKEELLEILPDFDDLMKEGLGIVISLDDKESYDIGKSVWQKTRNICIAIDKTRKKWKNPSLETGRNIDKFANDLRNPLLPIVDKIRAGMKLYEDKQNESKLADKKKKEDDAKKEAELTEKVKALQLYMPRINICKTKEEIEAIEKELADIDLNEEYGSKSGEAGFMVTQIKMMCDMAKKAVKVPDPIPEPEPEKVESKVEEVKKESITPNANFENKEVVENTNPKPSITETVKEKGIATLDLETKEEIKETPKTKTVDISGNGELNFGDVSDVQNGLVVEKKEEPKKYFSKEDIDYKLKNSVIPCAMYEGEDENQVAQILTVSSHGKTKENGLPQTVSLKVESSDSDITIIGVYQLVEIN